MRKINEKLKSGTRPNLPYIWLRNPSRLGLYFPELQNMIIFSIFNYIVLKKDFFFWRKKKRFFLQKFKKKEIWLYQTLFTGSNHPNSNIYTSSYSLSFLFDESNMF